MKSFTKLPALVCLALLSALATARAQAPAAGFFGGLGGSFSSVNFGNQSVFAVGTDNIFQNGALVASGSAGGPRQRLHGVPVDLGA